MTSGAERAGEASESLLAALPPARLQILRSARDVALALGTELYWVGGGIRDLIRGERDLDLDLVIVGGPGIERFGRALAGRLGATPIFHPRFLTCDLRSPDIGRLDVACARREAYPRPAMLPEVAPASLAEDLARRDFTINALAMPLTPELGGALVDLHAGRADLDAGRLRVLHPGSFVDDPTRLVRGASFEGRFGFRFEPATEAAARQAIAAGAVELVSGDRLGDALAKAAAHPEAIVAALRRLAELGFLQRLFPGLGFGRGQADRLEAARRALVEPPLSAATSAADWGPRLAMLVLGWELAPAERRRLGDRLALRASLRESIATGPERIAEVAAALGGSPAPSTAHALLANLDLVELAVLAGVSRPAREWVRRELAELRRLALRITGADLVRGGIPPGPALGRALARTLEARLDGALDAAGELAYALRVAREVER